MKGFEKEFVVTEDHIKLLRNAYVGWQDCETGAPEIDPKRPYGNSYVVGDIADILGVPEDEIEERQDELMEIHEGTEIALQIFLKTGTMKPGRYVRPDPCRRRGWELVKGKAKK